ncbi:Transient receptor potential channel pyrexia [Operophtera brumata]|uniref:Transient receptor potential channel pyrexia n=1 Tax=Operophtera brumata TaxID=104452 RepID=A0A0L7LR23_OPEBR|nr:Transient receptor potential channel pyrexia [Operophtera brumata]
MSVFRDLERGEAEDGESERPLLGTNSNSRPDSRMRPERPDNLGLTINTQKFGYFLNLAAWLQLHPLDRPPIPPLPDLTPSSASSTVTNTPVQETCINKQWRRSDRRLRRLNTELLEAIEGQYPEEVERLLNAGANPNATCRLNQVSACHNAALTGGDALALLIRFGAEKLRIDRLGRTPLHLAAYAGHARHVAVLLDFPKDVQERIDNESMSSETEEDVKRLCPNIRELTMVRCDLGEVNMSLPKNWKDNIDHNCKDIKGSLPLFQAGWTPLHVASSCARRHCTRLLLAAGADPGVPDMEGRTPLDVAGYAYYYNKEVNGEHFVDVIKLLLKAGGHYNTMRPKGLNNLDTPLHTAVELANMEAVRELLEAGAGVTGLNRAGQTPLHVLANYDYSHGDPMSAIVDVKDRDGHTVLQAAIAAAWVTGVCVALESGADVTLKANDGETPIHSAAALGNIEVLNEILSVAKQNDAIDYQNSEGETALVKAVINGHTKCLIKIINEGASLKITLPGEVNVFHVAADYGHFEILKELLEYDEAVTSTLINSLTAADRRGFAPIHFAVSNNHLNCVELLLSKNADILCRTTCSPHKASTPLHIAAVKNHTDIAKLILKYDKKTVHEVNSMGWYPLHTASHHGSRDIITILLKEGADLSGHTDGPKKYKRTAVDMIVHNLSKPTEFIEDVFDSYISSNGQDLQDPSCKVTVDYRILMPTVCECEQMKVIEALLKTGNRYGQRRLLIHPLVECFLYLKWKALLPFFYTIITIYGLFLLSLTTFIVSVFFFRDTNEVAPDWLDSTVWSYIVYAMISLVLVQLETWVKFGSLALAVILPYTVVVVSLVDAEWPRHVATLALLLSWLEMTFLLSRFPNWGYYILLTFAFLVIGFSLSFMIQFRSQMPFEGPWAAFVKTIVMMTSEFDYGSLFDEEHSKELATSLIIIRIIFLVFLILAAIVLMNLLVGVAVNDINDLEVLGNIRRLAKQVEFLGTLDTLVYNKLFSTILPRRVGNTLKNKRKVQGVMVLCPGKPRWKYTKVLPARLRSAIFNKAQSQKKQLEDEMGLKAFKTMMDEMHDTIVKRKIVSELSIPKALKNKDDEVVEHLDDIDNAVSELKGHTKKYVEESRCAIQALNVKMDQMSLDIKAVKEFLTRLESKLIK